ncbi:UvrD-helicase domain-containing protein [Shigella sonnei]
MRRGVNVRPVEDIEGVWLQHNQADNRSDADRVCGFFLPGRVFTAESGRGPVVPNGEHSLLVLAGAGSGKTSVLVARAGWLLARGAAVPTNFIAGVWSQSR